MKADISDVIDLIDTEGLVKVVDTKSTKAEVKALYEIMGLYGAALENMNEKHRHLQERVEFLTNKINRT